MTEHKGRTQIKDVSQNTEKNIWTHETESSTRMEKTRLGASTKMIWAGRVACKHDMTNTETILVRILKERAIFGNEI
jgi:hypothetical protein